MGTNCSNICTWGRWHKSQREPRQTLIIFEIWWRKKLWQKQLDITVYGAKWNVTLLLTSNHVKRLPRALERGWYAPLSQGYLATFAVWLVHLVSCVILFLLPRLDVHWVSWSFYGVWIVKHVSCLELCLQAGGSDGSFRLSGWVTDSSQHHPRGSLTWHSGLKDSPHCMLTLRWPPVTFWGVFYRIYLFLCVYMYQYSTMPPFLDVKNITKVISVSVQFPDLDWWGHQASASISTH